MDVKEAEKKIGVVFKDKAILEKAFTHRSYINEHRYSKLEHNERLEFLGDAVLELVVTEFLYEKFPQKNEGDLTAFRSALVNTNVLSDVSNKLNFEDHLRLSKGEAKDTGRARQYILANTLEAVIGAIYLDQGYQEAHKFIAKNIFNLLDEIIAKGEWVDAKSMFQERAQEKASVTPNYETLSETGPDHNKVFTVGVFLGGEQVATGDGKSKQEAEQSAARVALQKKGWL